MVSKAKSIKGSSEAVRYIQSDKELGDALELSRNGIISNDPNEIMREFRLLQEANEKCHKNTISMVISPSQEKKFTIPELREIGVQHLKELGLNDNQYLMTLHQSTGKPHIHIIANRIDSTGKALNDSFISLKSQEISEKIAKEKGLFTAKDIKKINDLTLQPIKEEIKKYHSFSVNNSKTFKDYQDLMHSKGVEIKPTLNKNGELQGFRLLHRESGINFKASEIGKNFGAKDLIKNGIQMPTLSPPLAKIAVSVVKQIAETVTRTARRGRGMGW